MHRANLLSFATALILLLSAGVAAHAQDSAPSAPPDKALQQLMTVDQFKDNLPGNSQELHLQEFVDLQQQGPVAILDLRDKTEFARRHLKASLNAPLTGLTDKTLPALVPDKKTPVVLVCDYSFMPTRMVAMTLQAYPVLKASGYTRIYRLNLWDDAAHKKMIDGAEQEKQLPFEGTDVTSVDKK